METKVLEEIGNLLADNCFLGRIGGYSGSGVRGSVGVEAYEYLVHLAEIGVEAAMELVPLVV